MRTKLTCWLSVILACLVGLGLAFVVYSVIQYKVDLYKRKYPGTTTIDYWLDSHK